MGKRQKQFLAGTLCLVLAAALVYGLLDSGESLALGGSPVWKTEDYDNRLWSYADGTDVWITMFQNLSIKQSLNAGEISLLQDMGSGMTEDMEIIEISGDTGVSYNTQENRTFTLKLPIKEEDAGKMTFILKNAEPAVDFDWTKWVINMNGNRSTVSDVSMDVHSYVTYYKLVEDKEADPSFESFFDRVKEEFGEKVGAATEGVGASGEIYSVGSLMTKVDEEGTAYKSAVETVLEGVSELEYKTDSDGTFAQTENEDFSNAARIDMLTVSYVDFKFALTRNDQTEKKSWDYDLALFQTYSYELDYAGEELEAPEPVLESRTVLSEGTKTNVSPDDVLTGLNVPDGNEGIKEEYANGTLQYLLSSTELSDGDLDTEDWQDFTEGGEIPLNRAAYLYTRVVPGEWRGTDKVYLGGDVKEYPISYITESPGNVTASAKAGTALETEEGYPGDSIMLQTDGAESTILYRTGGEALTLSKVSYGDRIRLNLDDGQPDRGVVFKEGTDGNLYVRVNKLWYNAGAGVQRYANDIDAVYTDGRMSLSALSVRDGCTVNADGSSYTFVKLEAPVLQLESGMDPEQEAIPKDDALSFSGVAEGTVVQYCLSTENLDAKLDSIVWEKWNGTAVPADGRGPYLYLRFIFENTEAGETVHVGSGIRVYQLSYMEEPPSGVTASLSAGTAVGEEYTDAVELKTRESGGLIFYSRTQQSAVFDKVADPALRTQLDSRTNGTAAVSIYYEDGANDGQYVRVNNLWYKCPAEVEYYDGPIEVSRDEYENNAVIYAWALADGRTVNGNAPTEIRYKKLTPPQVTLESGLPITGAVPGEDSITAVSAAGESGGTFQYYLSSRKLDSVPDTYWSEWTEGQSVSLNGRAYLYVRTVSEDSGVMDSAIQEYAITYITQEPGSVSATAYAGGEIVSDGIDYNDEIELIELNVEEQTGDVLIFYTLNAGNPSFTKVPYEKRQELGLDSQYAGSLGSAVLDGVRYVKVNNLWYECGADTQLYEERIQVDESIYENNYLTVNAQALENGCVISTPDRFSYSLTLRDQVEAPTATPAGGSTVSMGGQINLFCETSGSRIFYTVNGSAPVFNIRGAELVLGDNTYEFTDSPIVIGEDFAEYGSSATITVQAARFQEYNGTLSRVMQDSPLVRFTYQVDSQSSVGAVTSVPATGTDQRTEVQEGSRIHLYSSTEGAVIFYTLDGTEPVFDQDTLEPGNASTYEYNASQGITVPEIGDTSLFTVTAVAYREGLALSEISRLIFQYPSAVSAPYASPSAGSVTEDTQVTLRTATDGAVIYYEIAYGNDTPEDPTEDSSVYDASSPFTITRKTTIKAFAVKDRMESAVVTFTYDVSEKLSAPEPSIASGSVVASGTVISLEADSGATIYYTTDGSDPKASDNSKVLVGDRVSVTGKAGDVFVIRTYAARNGYSDSETGYYSYSISSYDGGIYADTESGSTVKNGDVVQLNTDVSDAVIYYTTDGTTPTQNSASGSAVVINGDPGQNVIVMAIAVAEGTERSISSATFTYTIMDRLAAPSASVPDGAVFTEEGQVALTAETGRIYYTTDGTDPSTASTLYKDPIVIDSSVQIKAVAVAEDYEQSSISSFSYGFADQVEAPTASYASGELEMGTTVTFASATEGATIYYRTDGVEPDTDDIQSLQVYTGPVTVNKATNFKVIAVKDKMRDSRVLSVGYTVREPEAPKVEDTEETQMVTGSGGRLQSRRSFADTQSGPSFTDMVLRNAVYGVVVSAGEGSLSENAQLQVERTQVTETTENMVRQTLSDNYGIVASYDVKLLEDGEEVQPSGEIEIGLPIPVEYENSLIRVVHVQEDGSVDLFATRRSGGVAYVMTDHLSVYSIAAPVEFQEEQTQFPWAAVTYTAAVALAGAGIFLLYRSKKMKREGRGQDE